MPEVRSKRAPDDVYRRFYQEHVRYVWKTLRRLGIHERDCQDLTQEVFVAVHRHFDERDPERPMKAWLFGFAYRVALGHKRRASTRAEVPTDNDVLADRQDSTRDVTTAMSARDAYLLVHQALVEVPMDQRAVIVLHDLDEVAAPAIATTLDVPLNTVYSRLRLGRERFRAALARLTTGGAP